MSTRLVWLAGVLVVGGSLAMAEEARAPHGAAPMARQLELMERLVPVARAGEAPVGVPPGTWKALVPADNPMTPEKVALGRKLYFDPRLSRDGTVACATCHDVTRGFTDQRAASEGIDDKVGRRNSPTSLNALFFETQFWDGRAITLEDQARLPIVNPIEMGQPDEQTALAAIAGDPEYQREFKAVFGRAPTFDDLVRAIGAFERTLVFLDAPFDAFLAGDSRAVSEDARAGWALFNGKARCASCHQINASNPIGTNHKFHNIGVSARHQDFETLAIRALRELARDDSQERIDRLALETDLSELGRFTVTRNHSDIGAFKTQQIRNVGITAPYMHDGSMQTLWDVMDHYNKGGEPNPYLDGGIEPLALSEREIDQLVAFMFAMTDRRFSDANARELERQRALAAKQRPFRDDAMASRGRLPFEPKPTAK
jgi:cytochrome c peroxidase